MSTKKGSQDKIAGDDQQHTAREQDDEVVDEQKQKKASAVGTKRKAAPPMLEGNGNGSSSTSGNKKAACAAGPKGDDSKSNSSRNKVILTPSSDDILMGRGWAALKHPGNQKMRSIIAEHKERYNGLSKPEKTGVVKELLRTLQKNGSRFLKKRESKGGKTTAVEGWEKATQGEAYEKVCHALRGKPRRRSETAGTSTDSSSSQAGVAGLPQHSHDSIVQSNNDSHNVAFASSLGQSTTAPKNRQSKSVNASDTLDQETSSSYGSTHDIPPPQDNDGSENDVAGKDTAVQMALTDYLRRKRGT